MNYPQYPEEVKRDAILRAVNRMPHKVSVEHIGPTGQLRCHKCGRPAAWRVSIMDRAAVVRVVCCAPCVQLPADELLNAVYLE